MRRFILVLGAMLLAAGPARAQNKGVHVSLGAAMVAPLSGSADNFSMGIGADIGVLWKFSDQAGLKFNFLYSGLGVKDLQDLPTPIIATPIDVKPRITFGTAAFVFQAPAARARPYVLGGVGVYHRSVTLTTPATGIITVCNPWWFVCYPAAVPVDRIIGSRATTDFGVNVGAGVSMGHFFVEARYHYMWGPTYDTPSGRQTATGKFFPLTVGVQF